jgi:hypothetical protein
LALLFLLLSSFKVIGVVVELVVLVIIISVAVEVAVAYCPLHSIVMRASNPPGVEQQDDAAAK